MIQPPDPVTRREAALVVLAGFVLAAYFTWPLALRPGSLGRVEIGDGQFSIWNVSWVAHAILTPGVAVFDANIFHPHRGTLAYSEPNLGAGVLGVPAYLLTENPYAAHNTAVLISLTMAVVGMYFLARRLSGSVEAAMVAATVFAFCPFIFARTSHIQLMMTAPLPFTLLALHRFVDVVTLGRSLALGVAIGIQALFCAYYGVLIGLISGLGLLVYSIARGYWKQPRFWGYSVLAALVSVGLVLPFFLPFITLQENTGFQRELREAYRYAADWRAYLASSAWAHTWMLGYIKRWNEVLFPGFTAVILGLAGMVIVCRRTGLVAASPGWGRGTTTFYVLVFVMTVWASFGPAAGLYSVLYHAVPVFSLLRAPARFGIAVTLVLAVFVAVAASTLLQRLSPVRRRLATAALLIFVIAELSTEAPYLPARDVPRAYKVLAAADPGPVAEFPFYHLPQDRFRHSLYMIGSTAHWLPLLNGYSDFTPPDFLEGAALLETFPNQEGMAWLRARGTRYVVFHLGLYGAQESRLLRQRIDAHAADLKPRYVNGPVLLYELAPVTGAP
jgi:hypothetical protein